MHVAPVVIVPHHVGPDGWTAAFGVIADTLDSRRDIPLTLRAPGAALNHVVGSEPELWGRLRRHGISWLAGGWSDPILADLPMAACRLQLGREKAAMDAAGVDPVGLWVGDGWERLMTSFAIESGFRLVYLRATLLPKPAPRPGAVDRAGDTVIVVPVATDVGTGAPDGLTAVSVEAGDLAGWCEQHRGRLASPDRYLIDHLPGPRLTPRVGVPGRSDDADIFYRKLLRVIADQSDRSAALDLVLDLESRENTAGDGGSSEAHHRLLEARTAVDRARHRGDTWVSVTEIDWDSDGIDEVAVETAATSLVVDAAAGTLAVWDDKIGGWPITSVSPATAGVLVRRLAEDGTEPAAGPMRMDRRTEGRAETRLTLIDPEGGLCRVVLNERTLTIRLTPAASDPVRIGPEMPVLVDAARSRLRVDGAEWIPASEPVAVIGHRFRLTDDARTLLVTSTRPCEMFVRPLPGRGLVVWPHWITTGEAEYQVSFEPV